MASVTGFAHNYRTDPFFRTEINIVALQAGFTVFLLLVIGVIAEQLYHDASAAVSHGIATALQPNSSPASVGTSVVTVLDYTRSRTVLYAAIAITFIMGFFTFVITRLALKPTRAALESQKLFIGNIAHELRTPLSIIKTNTEVALMGESVTAELRETLTSNIEELDRISHIINNLLSLSAFVRPERIEFTDVDMGAVARAAIAKLRPLAERKRLELTARMSERRVVWGNQTALEEIAINVVKNAITYTPHGGRILITVEPVHPDFIEFTVQDSGSGIARKDLFRIFEPFYRGDPSRKRGEGSSGLGLAIVSELVKMHHGKITVRSAEGRGTNVIVLLPASARSLNVEGIQRQKPEHMSEIAVDFLRPR